MHQYESCDLKIKQSQDFHERAPVRRRPKDFEGQNNPFGHREYIPFENTILYRNPIHRTLFGAWPNLEFIWPIDPFVMVAVSAKVRNVFSRNELVVESR